MPSEPDDVECEPLDRDGLRELLDQTVGDPERDVLVGQIGQEDPELVATEARHQVVVAKNRREAAARPPCSSMSPKW